MDYKEMLKKAKKELPEDVKNTERFEIPKVKGHIQGNKTIITNFTQIIDALRRDAQHLLKYLLKELATPGEITKTSLIIGAKVSASKINEKIERYAKEYVLCKECNKPDTTILKEGDFAFIKCMACGAKHPVKSKI
ncbi:translation initiation factor IF-2 subunit beta [Candidatus Woesearchaeota archaeon]|nr:translation initiation factor IF-2 subunit beta [Candidatus Woesearchaeota archaeon]